MNGLRSIRNLCLTVLALSSAVVHADTPTFLEGAQIARAMRDADGHLEITAPNDVYLSGTLTFSGGTLAIRSRGSIVARDFRVSAPGATITLDGRNVRLDDGTAIDVSGGEAIIAASDAVALSECASIDASGGGHIALAADDVRARGELLALGRGRIDVEAKRRLDFLAHADTGGGVIRLDPTNLIIGSFSGTNTNITVSGGDVSPSAPTGQLDAGNLSTLLATNDVIVHTTNAPGPGTGLQPAITGDATDGDISVEAEVTWNSAHSLWLLAHDDLIVSRSVQNAGAGAVVGIAGWDGTTLTGLDAAVVSSAVYGNGTGDAFILGSGTTLFAPGTAFGSRLQATAVRARNISVLGSASGVLSDAFAMIGYRIVVANDDAAGPIYVSGNGTLTMRGGLVLDRFRFAQIGHGGPVDPALTVGVNQGNLSGAIDVSAAGAISLLSGLSLGYCQIGHGGDLRQGAVRGNSSGDILVTGASLSLATSGGSQSATYSMIGHGGPTRFGAPSQGALGGNITVNVTGDVTLDVTQQFGLGDVMIGHGGVVNTTADSGNAALAPASLGTQTGDIQVTAGGNLSILGGLRSGFAQIGHGGILYGPGTTGAASGGITVGVTGNITLTAGATNFNSAQIGHGGTVYGNVGGKTTLRGPLSGSMSVTAGGNLMLNGGPGNISDWAQIGHGGAVVSLPGGAAMTTADGQLSVDANDILVQGGGSVLGYSQIGHGGVLYRDGAVDVANQGLTSGPLSVIAHGNLEVHAGFDSQGANYAQIGHGGQAFDGSGTPGVQAGASGPWLVQVTGETSLVDTPAPPNAPNQWWLGHRTTGTLSGAPVTLVTGTLDFTPGTGAPAATISDPEFWPRFVGDGINEADNASGGEVTLSVRGTGSDGQLIVLQPLTIPAAIANRVQAISSDDVTIAANVANNGSALVDIVADDANPTPPAFSPTALFTIDPAAAITGAVRLFAVAPTQFAPGAYVPPAVAFSVWHDTAGVPVIGANFKTAPAADLAVTKVDNPDPVTPGTNLTWTITVTNNGPDPADNASVSDVLPAGTTFVSLASPGGWSCTTPAVGSGGSISCSIATLSAGTVVFTLTANVDASTAGGSTITNTATVSSTTSDPLPGNESGTSVTTVAPPSADVSVTKVDTPDPVTPGTNLTYTITISNAGPSDAPSATLSDPLPANTTFISLASPGGWSCTTPPVGAGGTVSCSASSLVASTNAVFTLVVNVGSAVIPATVLSNTATASSAASDPNPGNENSTATTTVGAGSADLSVTKSGSPDPVTAGNDLTYTIAITNAGPSDAASLSLSDTLPAGTTFVSLASPAGWSCTTPAVGAGGAVTCTATTLSITTATFTLVVHVDPAIASGTVLVNGATVASATSDPNPGNETGTASTTVGAGSADLAVAKSGSPDPVTPGGNLTYTIAVSNSGPTTAASLQLSDTLPAGTTFVSLASPAGWSCTTPAAGAAGTITCTLASLGLTTETFTLVVNVLPSVPPATVLSNTATIASTTTDPAPGNESAAATTTVGAESADLVTTISDSPDPVSAGANVTYAIQIDNNGPSNAIAAQLTDVLPAGMTFVSVAPAAGWVCSDPGVGNNGTVTCTIASLPPGSASFTLVAQVTSGTAGGTVLSNTATASAATADPAPGNESATTTTTVSAPAGSVALTATKTASGTFLPGSVVTYTITLTNNGTATQSDNPGNELQDVLPSSLTLVDATASSGTAVATVATNTVTWNGAIAASASVTIIVHATIGVPAGTTISNQATFNFDADSNGTNESSGTSDDPAVGGTNNATVFVVGQAPVAIPTLTESMLLALALALVALGASRLRA